MKSRQHELRRRILSEQSHLDLSTRYAQRHALHILRGMQRIDTMQLELQSLNAKAYFVVIFEGFMEHAEMIRVVRDGRIIHYHHLTLGLPKARTTLTIRARGIELSVHPYKSCEFSVQTRDEIVRYEIRPCLSEQDAREFIEHRSR